MVVSCGNEREMRPEKIFDRAKINPQSCVTCRRGIHFSRTSTSTMRNFGGVAADGFVEGVGGGVGEDSGECENEGVAIAGNPPVIGI